jgi:DNA-binding NtrC family response regulator
MNATINSTILLLSSDALMRSAIQETLEHDGYTVLVARDLGTAVETLKKCQPDLLVMRAYVEGVPAYDAAKYLRTKCPGLPVLIVAGFMDDDRLQNRMILDRLEVFPTPFKAAAILEKVKDVLHPVS